MEKVLVIEPFSVDSHKLLVDFLEDKFETVIFALPAQKWHWKARTAALYFAQMIPSNQELQCRTLFASSVLNLAELVAMRPDLAGMKKVLYFHENQLVYPVRKQQERDFQYGYNQIISSLVADVVIFNSSYNMSSFLSSIPSFLNLIPDHRPQNIPQQITPKCHVIYLPLPIISFPHDAICSLKEVPTYKAQLQEEQGKSGRRGVSSKGDSYSPVKSKTIVQTSSVTIKPSHIKDDSLKLADVDFISNMQKANSENLHQERESCENENHQAFLNPEEFS
ncbi:putative glycosyltransferase-like domain-containing protein 1-like [Apostichopus japonicus]|uniref:tRNA-queuosine alpha-mannosyltransferase n=1 Tax=Stichopus japonicus TaxID=307972 RepID=A0A2G8K4P7_STIJA|nr:putative glycosyltransferase-like domain-containing protein 1-like [Apostichopus japonicus]